MLIFMYNTNQILEVLSTPFFFNKLTFTLPFLVWPPNRHRSLIRFYKVSQRTDGKSVNLRLH